MERIVIYDTTLRDGMQGTGINFTLEDKIKISHKLDEIGIDYIEGGFPFSNEKEAAFFDKVKTEKFENAQIVAFGPTRKPGNSAKKDAYIQSLVSAETKTIILVSKAWTEHVTRVIRTSLEENLEMIHDSISFLKIYPFFCTSK